MAASCIYIAILLFYCLGESHTNTGNDFLGLGSIKGKPWSKYLLDETDSLFEFDVDYDVNLDRGYYTLEGNPFQNSAAILPMDLHLNDLQYHGTTTLAFIFQHGVIIAVDSRASMGSYVGSRTVKKMFPVSKKPPIVATMAGGAADCAYWIRLVSRRASLLKSNNGIPLSVKSISKMLAMSLRNYRKAGLSVGTMVAGWDFSGPGICYVDNDGSCISGRLFCVGSGSKLAYAVLDGEKLKRNAMLGTNGDSNSSISGGSSSNSSTLPVNDQHDWTNYLSIDEAVNIATAAIRHATHRDGYSGGYINVVHIDKVGY